MIRDGTKVYGIKLLVLSCRSNKLYHYAIYTRLLWLQLWNDCSVLAWDSLALVGLKLCNRTIESDVYVWDFVQESDEFTTVVRIKKAILDSYQRFFLFVWLFLYQYGWNGLIDDKNKTTGVIIPDFNKLHGINLGLKDVRCETLLYLVLISYKCSPFILFLAGHLADYSPSEFLENLQISVLCYHMYSNIVTILFLGILFKEFSSSKSIEKTTNL